MLVCVLSLWLVQNAKVSLLYCMARCRDMMTCDTCAVDHMVRNPGGFHLCILKTIKNWTWEEARLNLPLPTVAMATSLILIGIIRLRQWVVCTKCIQGGHMSLCGQDRADLGCSCGPMYMCFRYCYCRQLTVR